MHKKVILIIKVQNKTFSDINIQKVRFKISSVFVKLQDN